ncbi:MAG: tryptophan synthase subunit alpha [Christensenellaceae bacterium]|jgi:tryptophan synthase alpha chain|nr:tryptophan synthase subunit alpha [Christensenellaceae bacterium]
MSKISDAFKNGKAFIPFITGGDPSLSVTETLLFKLVEAGADIIEIGIPFSDPTAEGPVIQAADERALAAGCTTDKLLELVKKVRKSIKIPLLFMTYYNPIFVYGAEKFAGKCAQVGIDGLIVPDLPFEEREELLVHCEAFGVELVSMIAPTSDERTLKIAKESKGFIYCVSSLGVTGERKNIGNAAKSMIETAKTVTDTPCAVGFGISDAAQAKEIAKFADGVIVGSAIVKIVGQYGEQSPSHVYEFAKGIKDAVKTPCKS